MVSDVPDTAYEICTKYAPGCNQGIFSSHIGREYIDVSRKSRPHETRKKSSNKTKASSKKSRKAVDISSNTRKRQNVRPNAESSFLGSENFDEFENLEIDSTGEDEAYYDSLNSGNEGIYGRVPNFNTNSVTLNPFLEVEEGNYSEETIIHHDENHNVNGRNKTIVTTVDYDLKSESRWVKGEKGDKGDKGMDFMLKFQLNQAQNNQLIRRRRQRRFRWCYRPSRSTWSCFYVINNNILIPTL